VDSPSCGAFGAAAQALMTAGLVPVPCGGETDKKPLIRYRNLDERMNQNFLTELLQNDAFRSAGVGVLTGVGQYPITVVDVDDPTALARVTELFGPTPVEVATPSDGRHLWFLSQGEGCPQTRRTNNSRHSCWRQLAEFPRAAMTRNGARRSTPSS